MEKYILNLKDGFWLIHAISSCVRI